MRNTFVIAKIIFAVVFVFMGCFPANVSATGGELTLFKDNFYDGESFGSPRVECDGTFYVDIGHNVYNLRDDFNYYLCDGSYTLTLEGPSGTTVTLYDQFGFDAKGGYITLRKTDDRMIWLYDLEKYVADQWVASEADKDSGAFEVYYHAAPSFKKNISSIKWAPHSPGKG